MSDVEVTSYTKTTVRYVIGTAANDIISSTPHVSLGSAVHRLGLMQEEWKNNPPSWAEDLKIFKVTSTEVYEEL